MKKILTFFSMFILCLGIFIIPAYANEQTTLSLQEFNELQDENLIDDQTSATDINTVTELEDYGQPYEETTYYDEDLQATVTERSYFVPDTQEGSVLPLNNSKGSAWFKTTKDFEWTNSDKVTTTYAKGYFTWSDGNVSVSKEDGGYNYFPSSMKILEEELTTGTGKYGFIFNNYAYIKYTFKFKNFLGKTQDLSVRVRVSESGKKI